VRGNALFQIVAILVEIFTLISADNSFILTLVVDPTVGQTTSL